MHYTPKDVAKFGSILGIWAHPDDEVFASGGLIASASANGQSVYIITATKGEAGGTADEQRWPRSSLSTIREKELAISLQILGNVIHNWLDCRDGELDKVNIEEVVEQISMICAGKEINTIVTFEPEGITGHPDHKTVHKWATLVAEKLGCRQVLCAIENEEFYESFGRKLDEKNNIYFATERPNCVCKDDADVCLKLPLDLQQKKYKSLAAHESQTSKIFADPESENAISKMCECECYMSNEIKSTS